MAADPSVPERPSASGEASPGPSVPAPPAGSDPTRLGSGAYEVLRQRLAAEAARLVERMQRLDARRQEVFGAIEWKILQADRVSTAHNCVPRDMVQLGPARFLFGFNVQFGLKKETGLGDVFAVYERDVEAGLFREGPLEVLEDPRFLTDFRRLYGVYARTVFSKFSVIEGCLYMVFRVGAGAEDIAVFKWVLSGDGLQYVDGRAEHEFRKRGRPPSHPVAWRAPDREAFRYGDHPHVSIEDRVFVECIGGDLTIKVEDNTATGEGVYSEPVEDRHQKVDDADIRYAIVGPLILLRIRPYKEEAYRHFIFNGKLQSVDRVETLGDSYALLPEDHGLIFPDGYYLVTGELKRFENRETGMVLERVVAAPNGEDWLFVFYSPVEGVYALLPYRLIAQKVEERLACHGFSLFPNGHLLLFRADPEPQKHHQVQLRQTAFHEKGHEPPGQRDAFLYRVGNREVVRCLAEINEVLTLVRREQPYAELYADLVRRCDAILDAHRWLGGEDGFGVDETLRQVRAAADQAVDEFDKVRRLQREAVARVREAGRRGEERAGQIRRASFTTIDDYVQNLTALRQLRGELVALREVRYVDLAEVGRLEEGVVTQAADLAKACLQFLLRPEALAPYQQRAAEQMAAVEGVTRAAEGRRADEALAGLSGDLEMLIEVVNSLRIEDATETARIIDGITAVYATLNQARAALKKRLVDLVAAEGAAQFASQMKLVRQSAASFLDLCDTPAKCEEYLNRISVQLEELEGAFADFEAYVVQVADLRTELYEAFEQRKVALIEQRSRRAANLMEAGERVLRVVRNRLAACTTVDEIRAYAASDLMVAKVRETIAQLMALGDPVRADDLEGRLKGAQQEAVRQLKDRQELFVGGQHTIQLGRHRFHVNTQPLDLTVVVQDGVPHLHLTGTKYFEAITDDAVLQGREAWDQEVISEDTDVYRAEYLAWSVHQVLERRGMDTGLASALEVGAGAPVGGDDGAGSAGSADSRSWPTADEFRALPEPERLKVVQDFMGARYQEGYARGLHDLDGLGVLEVLVEAHESLGLARYDPTVRALALVYWERFCPDDLRVQWSATLRGFAVRNRLFPGDPMQGAYVRALRELLAGFARATGLYAEDLAASAGEYLFHELTGSGGWVASATAQDQVRAFAGHLSAHGGEGALSEARRALAGHPVRELELVRDYVRGYVRGQPEGRRFLEEIAAWVFVGTEVERRVAPAVGAVTLEGMKGAHPRVAGSRYHFDYLSFQERLGRFAREVVPRFEGFQRAKRALLDRERARLRLGEFQPRVLTTFVRNQLIDRVYLPLVGDNLAKQVGVAGEGKRTDLMGLLLLISPPGYGKTTLVEYLANRLGLVFIKINGPALGHGVTSLDPEEAPNAAAREEIHRLNLALEMGDNVMLCVDDIQHCHPEFLQKFISLCDAQRRIEGVWRGRPRTYDLRGRKVAVVMAGNPYTESGQRFKLPDMLANRADTYNLGDILGGHADVFRASYLENAVTSNPVLAPLASRNPQDVRAFIRVAETGDREAGALEGSYAAQEVEEILAVLTRLVTVREVVLRVNQEYIRSAGQAEEFRTEPAFRLQGSYRNMNRLAEKVAAVMNETEVRSLILDHYTQEAQTLTTGAEANLLKFKELTGWLSAEEGARWEEIRRTFRRNQVMRGADSDDPMGRVVAQLATFHGGLEAIREALVARPSGEAKPPPVVLEFGPIAEGLKALRADLVRSLGVASAGANEDRLASVTHELEMIHSTLATLKDLAAQQRDRLQSANELLAARARQGTVEFELTQEMLTDERAFLDRFHQVLAETKGPAGETPAPGAPAEPPRIDQAPPSSTPP